MALPRSHAVPDDSEDDWIAGSRVDVSGSADSSQPVSSSPESEGSESTTGTSDEQEPSDEHSDENDDSRGEEKPQDHLHLSARARIGDESDHLDLWSVDLPIPGELETMPAKSATARTLAHIASHLRKVVAANCPSMPSLAHARISLRRVSSSNLSDVPAGDTLTAHCPGWEQDLQAVVDSSPSFGRLVRAAVHCQWASWRTSASFAANRVSLELLLAPTCEMYEVTYPNILDSLWGRVAEGADLVISRLQRTAHSSKARRGHSGASRAGHSLPRASFIPAVHTGSVSTLAPAGSSSATHALYGSLRAASTTGAARILEELWWDSQGAQIRAVVHILEPPPTDFEIVSLLHAGDLDILADSVMPDVAVHVHPPVAMKHAPREVVRAPRGALGPVTPFPHDPPFHLAKTVGESALAAPPPAKDAFSLPPMIPFDASFRAATYGTWTVPPRCTLRKPGLADRQHLWEVAPFSPKQSLWEPKQSLTTATWRSPAQGTHLLQKLARRVAGTLASARRGRVQRSRSIGPTDGVSLGWAGTCDHPMIIFDAECRVRCTVGLGGSVTVSISSALRRFAPHGPPGSASAVRRLPGEYFLSGSWVPLGKTASSSSHTEGRPSPSQLSAQEACVRLHWAPTDCKRVDFLEWIQHKPAV
mmetsp:Transcript_23217/g.68419  ORF Transcript_23217/g.68419 Transcript_23217/m.68419 type:complete len:648 (+) Transcript_23217:19-1962(+)